MLNSNRAIASMECASVSAMTTLILKIFMMYNLWQDVFVASGIAATFKNLSLYILFMCSNWLPISLSLMKYIGVPLNFSISTTTIWLAIFCIISEAFMNSFYKEYKKSR